MDRRRWLSRSGWILGVGAAAGVGYAASRSFGPKGPYSSIERILTPLCEPLGPPAPNDWLAEHAEPGQSFDAYVKSNPVRRDARLTTIYLSVLGDASDAQKQVFERTRDYMSRFFDTPVKFADPWPLDKVPGRARRVHSARQIEQILTSHVLDEMLTPARPPDALAYLALTSCDLWPGMNWNFVFGQASLRNRVGVWSIHRFGDPALNEASFRLCLRRTLGTATHETMHILSMPHCIQYLCCLNGCNHLIEADSKPLHTCAVCERKLSWNLGNGPLERFDKLRTFCLEQGFQDDAKWFSDALMAISNEPAGVR